MAGMHKRALLVLPWLWAAVLAAPAGRAQEAGDAKAPARAQLECADEVAKDVARLRGWEWKRPVEKDVRTRAELAEVLQEMFAKEYGGGKLERTNAWLQVMGLMPKDADLRKVMTDVLLTQIGGFYDPAKQSFFMMAEASEFGDSANRMMIAHELCHALDDQYVDLRALQKPGGREPTEDESYAISGVVEGSATALMFAWMADAQGRGKVDLKDMTRVAEKQAADNKVLLAAPPYCLLLVANYMVGLHFVTKGRGMAAAASGDDTGAAIREAAKAMPRSSEQLLHPDKYWDPKQRDEPVVLRNDEEVAKLVNARTGFAVLERNTLGELVCALMGSSPTRKLNLMLMARADYWTNKAARGWGGDRLLVLGKGTVAAGKPVEEPGVVWITAWDTETDRTEFVEAVRKQRGETPGCDVAEHGKAAVFTFGSARKLSAEDLQAVLAACRFEQDGAAWRPD